MTSLRRFLVLVACVLTVSSAWAEVNRGDGAQTGDGSTPFTGLAQAPEANLFVGAATTSIPIEVPPGRKNLTPKLALTYNSNAGPGPYGYGWDLPLGKIQRSTKHGVLSCANDTYRDDFVLVLPGASVECTLGLDSNDPNRCVPKIEESFVRIKYRPDTNEFEAWDTSGLHYLFGASTGFGAATRTGSDTDHLFTTGSPCTYTFSWALSQIKDLNGNVVEIWYEQGEGVLRPLRARDRGHYRLRDPLQAQLHQVLSMDLCRPDLGGLDLVPGTTERGCLGKVTTEYDPGCGKLLSQTIMYKTGETSAITTQPARAARWWRSAMPSGVLVKDTNGTRAVDEK